MPGGEKRQMVLLTEQWGRATFADGANITLPIPFPNAFLTVAVTSHPSDTGGVEVVQGYPVNLSAFRLGAAVYQEDPLLHRQILTASGLQKQSDMDKYLFINNQFLPSVLKYVSFKKTVHGMKRMVCMFQRTHFRSIPGRMMYRFWQLVMMVTLYGLINHR